MGTKRRNLLRTRRLAMCALLLVWLIGTAMPLAAQEPIHTEKQSFRVRVLTRGLDHPWSLAFLPDGRMLVSERPGRLRIVSAAGTLQSEPVKGLPANIAAAGQGGLFDVALHPDFASNQWVYVAYAGAGEGGVGTELARARLQGDTLVETRVLFRALPKSQGGRHFGGRVVFDGAGRGPGGGPGGGVYLFLTLGERGDRQRAQRLDDHAGSIIRLNDDGSVPADNPFAGRAGARAEIFTFGNRNVQGAAMNPWSGELWAHEHGPQGGDEVNVIRAGVNYGWPVITYGVNYGFGTSIGEGTHKDGMAQPLHYWDPSIAPSGMAFYDGDRFPAWRGSLFVGALKFRLLVRLQLDGEKVVREERMLEGVLGRIRDVRVGPDSLIYLLTDDGDGVIARLEPL